MKIPLSTIVNKEFSEAFARLLDMKLSGKEAYTLSKAARIFITEAKDFETARLAILKKYGKQDGDQFKIEDEHDLSDANAEMALVMNKDVEIPLNPITVPADGVISARDLLILEALLEP
jgi:hypothetical protein